MADPDVGSEEDLIEEAEELDEDLGDNLDEDTGGGEGDDEGDDEDPDGLGADPSPSPAPGGPTRGENRVAAATRIAAEAKARADALEAELAAIRNQRNTESQDAARRAEEARVANMSPDERLQYDVQQMNRRLDQSLAEIRFNAADATDRTQFEAEVAKNKAVASVADEVEKILAEMRKTGVNSPRLTIAKYVIGERALTRSGRATAATERRVAGNRERNVVRAPNSRGDVGAGTGRQRSERQARDARLENVEL